MKEAVATLAKLRLARLAAECRLRKAFARLRDEVLEELRSIPDTFGAFKEELQHSIGLFKFIQIHLIITNIINTYLYMVR